ncbi:MAG: hypothetical protein M0031_03210 [Thermaerobacter sp.]|nr:hypothetical protein [Thermaerobacter sp.]
MNQGRAAQRCRPQASRLGGAGPLPAMERTRRLGGFGFRPEPLPLVL